MPSWEVLHLFIPQLCSELCRFPSSLFEGCFSLHIITSCCSSGFDRLSCPWSDRWLVIWPFLCPDIRSLGSSFWTLGFPHCLPPLNPHAIYNPQRTRVGKGVIVSSYKQNIHMSLMSCPPSWSHFMSRYKSINHSEDTEIMVSVQSMLVLMMGYVLPIWGKKTVLFPTRRKVCPNCG